MRRRLPYFTPVSILIAIALVLGTGFIFWKTGGFGISPGPVTGKSRPGIVLQGFSSHADLEQDCLRCHQPLSTSQAALCLDCHQTVKQQIDEHTALHGSLPSETSCAACHAEHKGRDFDPTVDALAGFNHDQTRFPLTGEHLTTSCEDCHQDNQFRFASADCIQCHKEPRVHKGMFGQDCAACHSADAWTPATNDGRLMTMRKLVLSSLAIRRMLPVSRCAAQPATQGIRKNLLTSKLVFLATKNPRLIFRRNILSDMAPTASSATMGQTA